MKKIVHYNKDKIMVDVDISREYATLIKKINKLQKELEPIEKQLKQELKDTMIKLDKKKVVLDNGIVASLKSAYIRNNFDTQTFKEEHNKLYNSYLVPKKVDCSIGLEVVE